MDCVRGPKAIASNAVELMQLLKGVRLHMTQLWTTEDETTLYYGGNWVVGYECKLAPEMFQLHGHTYVQHDKTTGKVLKDINMVNVKDFYGRHDQVRRG